MKITTIKTAPVTRGSSTIFQLINQYVRKVPEESIFVITSKVVSLCEGRSISIQCTAKKDLIQQEAEYWLSGEHTYGITLTIKGGRLIPTAGIDESNGNGEYILWPKNPYASAYAIWRHLRRHFKVKRLGVIVTDSATMPLRYGTCGVAIGCAGFEPLKDYIGTPDIFGRRLEVTKANIVDALAAAAVVTMGEGSEQTPFALITNVAFVKFRGGHTNQASLRINLTEDIYAPLLQAVRWRKGGQFGKVS